MSLWSSDAEVELSKNLLKVVSESGLSYKESMSALNYVFAVLKDKGDNLLNATNIQEVVKVSRNSQ